MLWWGGHRDRRQERVGGKVGLVILLLNYYRTWESHFTSLSHSSLQPFVLSCLFTLLSPCGKERRVKTVGREGEMVQ